MQHWLQEIYERDHGLCGHCHEPVDLLGIYDNAPELDHVLPVDLGGSNHPRNKILTHRRCNRAKGSEYSDSDIAREVPPFLCVVCGKPIPDDLLGRPGQIRKTCSKDCRSKNKRKPIP